MLRLKASEITLTPVDVEETRRRMERTQAARPLAAVPAWARGPLMPPGYAPRLRRGPGRSRDNALATLGNIPVLQPQEGIRASAEDAADIPPQNSETSIEDSDSATSIESILPPYDDQVTQDASATSSRLLMPPAVGSFHLPFRPASSGRDCVDRFVPRGAVSEDISVSPPKQILRPPRFGTNRTNSEDGIETSLLARIHASTDGLVEATDTFECPSTIRNLPLRHRGNGDTDLDLVQNQQQDERSSLRYLRGYFTSNQGYTFSELMPQTEPCPRTRMMQRVRTISSSSEPPHSIQEQGLHQSGSSKDDVFWNASAPEPPYHSAQGTNRTARSPSHQHWSPLESEEPDHLNDAQHPLQRLGSEASSTSLPYSFYELPESRYTSSNMQPGPLEQAQYDGTANSRQVSQGAYHSIRLRPHQATNRIYLRPPPPSRVPSISSPDLTSLGQHGLSPSPADPYTRASSAQHSLRPSVGLISANDLVGDDQDAVSALRRNLSSPLDLLQERASSYFHRIAVKGQASPSQMNPVFRHHIVDVDGPPRRPRQRRMSDSNGLRQHSGNRIHSRTGAESRHRGRYTNQQSDPQRPPTQHSPIARSQAYRRAAPAARAGQRSSENVAVEIPAHERRLRATRQQAQRLTLGSPSSGASMRGGETLSSPVIVRFSMPQAPRSHDVPSETHVHFPYPTLPLERSIRYTIPNDDSFSPDARIPSEGSEHQARSTRGAPIPPRHAFRQHDSGPPRRGMPSPPMQYQHQGLAPPIFNRPPFRGLPSTSTTLDVASGITSRRLATTRATSSHRQIPLHQQDQENSQEAERQAMREEFALVGMRYGEGDSLALETMDETPPRMGRIERAMGNQ